MPPASGKRRKVSGLSGLELELTIERLKAFLGTLSFEEVSVEEESEYSVMTEDMDGQLRKMIDYLETRAREPLNLAFSAVTQASLARLNITQAGLLVPTKDREALKRSVDSTRVLGAKEPWSDDFMYKHLTFLLNNSARTSEAASRLIIDAFLFRAVCMIPSDKRVVLELEKGTVPVKPLVSKLDEISGQIDFTALLTNPGAHQYHLHGFPLEKCKAKGFFVREAKMDIDGVASFPKYIAQTVVELVACAKLLRQSHIRGAVTTGLVRVFIAVDVGAEGATFWETIPIRLAYDSASYPASISRTSDTMGPAFIAAVLSTWLQESSVKFEGDEWFFKLSGEE